MNPITKPIIDFCAGYDFMCAVFDNNKMKCVGKKDNYGSLTSFGDSASTVGDNIAYFNPGSNLSINKVTCLYFGICVLLNDGNIKCVGDNTKGEVGIGLPTTISQIGENSGHAGDTLPKVNLGNGVTVASFFGGFMHTCIFVTTEGKVKCYGWNDFGQLGYEDKKNRGDSSTDMGDGLPFIEFGAGVEVASIHSDFSSSHNCVILSKPVASAQRVKCWGFNQYYQLGYGDQNHRGDEVNEMGDNLLLVDLGTESKVKQLALSEIHTCALLINDMLKCWGSGFDGKLGSGSNSFISVTGNSMPFVLVDSGKTIKSIDAGTYNTCILYDDMLGMKCIGNNYFGQLGQGDQLNRGDSPETMIPNITFIDLGTGSIKIASIHVGGNFNCAVFVDNGVKCFGNNDFGKLGIGSQTFGEGDEPYEMGNNLTYSKFFSPSTSPTKVPSRAPTHHPTFLPTIKCDYQSAKLCKYDYNCMWKKVNGVKQCTVFDCTTLNQGKCGKERKKCKWNKKTSTCDTKKQ